jgi:hypothetical protein
MVASSRPSARRGGGAGRHPETGSLGTDAVGVPQRGSLDAERRVDEPDGDVPRRRRCLMQVETRNMGEEQAWRPSMSTWNKRRAWPAVMTSAAALALAAALAAVGPVAAQTVASPAPEALRNAPPEIDRSRPGGDPASPPRDRSGGGPTGDDIVEDRQGGGAAGGVIRPPMGVDAGIQDYVPDPTPRTTPVIPPPGTPGGNPRIDPR